MGLTPFRYCLSYVFVFLPKLKIASTGKKNCLSEADMTEIT